MAWDRYLGLIGLGWLMPIARMFSGKDSGEQIKELWQQLGIPVLAIAVFIALWAEFAPRVDTSLGVIPGPGAVWSEAVNLVGDHRAEREKENEFYARQDARNADRLAADPNTDVRVRQYTGKPTYFDQILTSLKTVFAGFVLAMLVAVPLGVVGGLSRGVNAGVYPRVRI
jgi:nitrate/nitrite transport system permease protein